VQRCYYVLLLLIVTTYCYYLLLLLTATTYCYYLLLLLTTYLNTATVSTVQRKLLWTVLSYLLSRNKSRRLKGGWNVGLLSLLWHSAELERKKSALYPGRILPQGKSWYSFPLEAVWILGYWIRTEGIGHLKLTKHLLIIKPRTSHLVVQCLCHELVGLQNELFGRNDNELRKYFVGSLGSSSPLCYKQVGRGWGTSKPNCRVSYLLCWRRPTTKYRWKFRMCTYTMIILRIVFLYIHFCDLKMAYSGRNMSSSA